MQGSNRSRPFVRTNRFAPSSDFDSVFVGFGLRPPPRGSDDSPDAFLDADADAGDGDGTVEPATPARADPTRTP